MGLWEDGKKLRWLRQEEIAAIELGSLNEYTTLFSDTESVSKLDGFPLQFGPPMSYPIARQRLVQMVHEMGLPV